MRSAVVVLALMSPLAACEKSTRKSAAETPVPSPTTGSYKPAAESQDPKVARVAADVRAAMTEFSAYTESVIVIMREHGKDCDLAAKLLVPRAQVFAELGPKMMKLKESLQALPVADRERIKQDSERDMKAFMARNPDTDALLEVEKACEKTSPAFAEIAPKVMMVKKK